MLLGGEMQPVVIRRHVEFAYAAGDAGALLDAHQPFVLAQFLADLARHLKKFRRRAVDLPEDSVKGFLRNLGVVAQRLERLLLPFEFLQQVGFEVGATRDLQNLEEAQQCDVMLLRIGLRAEIERALVQVLEPQQSTDPLAQWVFVADHGASEGAGLLGCGQLFYKI